MHKRPDRSHRRAGTGPRLTLVTNGWGNPNDERQFAARAFAGAASTVSDVTILHLTSTPTRTGEDRDGAFRVRQLHASAPLPMLEAILLASLGSADVTGHLPAIAGPDLHALEGGKPADIAAAIAETSPDVIVVAGLGQAWLPYALATLDPRPCVVVLPLMGSDPRMTMAGYRGFLDWADVIGVVSPGERALVESLDPVARGGSPAPIIDLRVAMPVNIVAARHRGAGLTRFDNYVLFLRGFPEGTVGSPEAPDYRRIRSSVPGLGIADVSHEGWKAYTDDLDYTVPVAPSRINLLRLVSHAIAVVDLRPGGVLGRETIESLLLGTPVLVPDTSPARDIVAVSGGGLVYSGEAGLEAAIEIVTDARQRADMSKRGRHWAEDVHGSSESFVQDVVKCVLGATGPAAAQLVDEAAS